MNEAQLLQATRERVETHWGTSHLWNPWRNRNCLLGAIGYARWGDQFNVDCEHDEGEQMYDVLANDPVTESLIDRLSRLIRENFGEHIWFESNAEPCVDVYNYNDGQDFNQPVLELLDKAIAEVGFTCPSEATP